MKRLIIWLAILMVVIVAGWAASQPAMEYLKEQRRVKYREVEATRGRIVAVVNSTGTIKPVRYVNVGSFVSGPIENVFVRHNDEVKKGQLLAKVDPKLYKAAVDRDEAALASRQADSDRACAELQRATNDQDRALGLLAQNPTFISQAEMDKFRFDREVLEAQVKVAGTNWEMAQATLENSRTQLGYTDIIAPEDGIVIDCKVEPGQTVQSAFSTPDMFVLAPDMKKEMLIFANVDEADIGQIYEAQETKQPVQFTVDTYPDQLFQGHIYQIRKSSTTTQNVVTYPVVVSAPNPDLKLYPGMTANISFQLREKDMVLRVPNAALRFYPQRDQVRPEDRPLLESKNPAPSEVDEQVDKGRSAQEKAELRRQRNRRHVWVVDGDFLRAVEVITGLSDNTFTEVVSGDLRDGEKMVTGVQAK